MSSPARASHQKHLILLSRIAVSLIVVSSFLLSRTLLLRCISFSFARRGANCASACSHSKRYTLQSSLYIRRKEMIALLVRNEAANCLFRTPASCKRRYRDIEGAQRTRVRERESSLAWRGGSSETTMMNGWTRCSGKPSTISTKVANDLLIILAAFVFVFRRTKSLSR